MATLTPVMMALYAGAPRSARHWRRRVQVWWCRSMAWIVGLRVRRIGTPNARGVTVFCANHVSYFDILAVSRHLDGTYVAKREVGTWPLFGSIAKITGTILVERTAARARAQGEEIRRHLAGGDNLILFPEGTSTDGAGVAPFKSSLLAIASPGAAAEAAPPIFVQPVSIAYVRDVAGVPLTGARRDLYCWYGDMTLAPHLWRALGLPGADVELRVHPPLTASAFPDRKALARECQRIVAKGVAAAHAAAPPASHEAAAE